MANANSNNERGFAKTAKEDPQKMKEVAAKGGHQSGGNGKKGGKAHGNSDGS